MLDQDFLHMLGFGKFTKFVKMQMNNQDLTDMFIALSTPLTD